MVQILPTGSLKKEWGVRLSPKNTTATAYVMFVKSLKVPEGENRMTLAAAFWNNMTDSEKKPYQDSADEANSSKDLDLE
jgi:hypothetical protein